MLFYRVQTLAILFRDIYARGAPKSLVPVKSIRKFARTEIGGNVLNPLSSVLAVHRAKRDATTACYHEKRRIRCGGVRSERSRSLFLAYDRNGVRILGLFAIPRRKTDCDCVPGEAEDNARILKAFGVIKETVRLIVCQASNTLATLKFWISASEVLVLWPGLCLCLHRGSHPRALFSQLVARIRLRDRKEKRKLLPEATFIMPTGGGAPR